MKNILFYIATEFHYMVALSMIDKYYIDPEFKIYFIISCNPLVNVNRLDKVKFDKEFTILKATYDISSGAYYAGLMNSVKEIKSIHFFHFVSFLYFDPLFVYLSYYLKKNKTSCYLAPDGMIAYVKFYQKNIRSRFYHTLNSYRFFARHKLYFPKFWITNWNYGYNGYVDYIYAFSSTLPFIKKKFQIIEIEYHLTPEKIESLLEMYDIDFSKIRKFDNIVLIINERHNGENFEKELITLIQNTLPTSQILFKKHPNTLNKNIKYLEEYENVIVMEEIFPIELLIAKLKHSIIISSYSTASLYVNHDCKYFWTYPIVEQYGVLRKPVDRFNPTKHIEVIYSMEQLSKEFQKFEAISALTEKVSV